ncbi:MmcQ/YjbR family DNA-binding protein [Glutamicibacter creatinolyticus]|uniref:MmcQ/YjbR family DNA-binding protein n=1 Tax=Glutamicibacter creatinolyticus TaxID=162496 RepID=UPI0033EB6CD5
MSLSGKQIQHIAAEVAKRLPGTGSGYPFTEHLQVWKVAGKVFLIITEDEPELEIITVKTAPDHGDKLRRDHASISRGHYLNKQHWISVASSEAITRSLVEHLVEDSYDLAKHQAPVKDRPEEDV